MAGEKRTSGTVISGRSLSLIGLIVATALLLFAVYSVIFPTYHVRYRLEFVVQDHGQQHRGSGVVEVVYHLVPDGLSLDQADCGGCATQVYGYAITTDLGTKGLLFAVLSNRRAEDPPGVMGRLPLLAYGLETPSQFAQFKIALHQLTSKGGWVEIPPEQMPMFVRFQDIRDPWSAENVDPSNLAATYGAGVKLVSARLALTRDSVTEPPVSWPQWLKTFKGNLGGAGVTSQAPFGLRDYDFQGKQND